MPHLEWVISGIYKHNTIAYLLNLYTAVALYNLYCYVANSVKLVRNKNKCLLVLIIDVFYTAGGGGDAMDSDVATWTNVFTVDGIQPDSIVGRKHYTSNFFLVCTL